MSAVPTTVRLGPELHQRVKAAHAEFNERANSPRISLSAYLEWCIRQVIDLEFLNAENRDGVEQVAREAGYPWTPLMAVNSLVGVAREAIAAGRVEPRTPPLQAGAPPKKYFSEESERIAPKRSASPGVKRG